MGIGRGLRSYEGIGSRISFGVSHGHMVSGQAYSGYLYSIIRFSGVSRIIFVPHAVICSISRVVLPNIVRKSVDNQLQAQRILGVSRETILPSNLLHGTAPG